MFLTLVFIIGTITGFLTGLLGIGGGIVIFPAYLYILPALGIKSLSLAMITGLAAAQVFTGSFLSFCSHLKRKNIQFDIILIIGIMAGIGSLIGSILSGYLPDKVLLTVYLFILIISIISFINDNYSENPVPNPTVMNVLSLIAGAISGAVGMGGSVMYIPIIRYFHNLSVKKCITNASFIVLLTGLMALIGKTINNQVPYHVLIYAIAGSVIGSKIGIKLCYKLSSEVLKKYLIGIIAITAVRVFINIIS